MINSNPSLIAWRRNPVKTICVGACVLAELMTGIVLPVSAAQLDDANSSADVDVLVLPYAELTFLENPRLYLQIVPFGDSTQPTDGVDFQVVGNADAIVTAEPDGFINVPGEGYMGKAVLNGNAVGYQLLLRFPRGPSAASTQYAGLPISTAGATEPPLRADVSNAGGKRGTIDMDAYPNWTESGGIPLPGLYVGQVILTVIAD